MEHVGRRKFARAAVLAAFDAASNDSTPTPKPRMGLVGGHPVYRPASHSATYADSAPKAGVVSWIDKDGKSWSFEATDIEFVPMHAPKSEPCATCGHPRGCHLNGVTVCMEKWGADDECECPIYAVRGAPVVPDGDSTRG
jgi:hypothetical protein